MSTSYAVAIVGIVALYAALIAAHVYLDGIVERVYR